LTASDRIVGVVPAAGHATRLQPLVGSKEMINVDGRPVVQLLLDGLRAAGCDEIRVVTRPEKRDLAGYVREQGATVVLATPGSVSESLLAGSEGLADGDTVLTGFPDTVWEPANALAQVHARLVPPIEVVLGLFRVPPDADCDRVRLSDDGAVVGIDVKPHPPTAALTWGCVATRVSSLRRLEAAEPGEIFDALCREGRVAGVFLSDRYLDLGTRDGLGRLGTWLDGRGASLDAARG
jgi:glucose-1-phosphate thymidylyltransferase